MFVTTPSLLRVVPSNGKPVTGITVLGNEVFVVQETSEVYVYDSTYFTSTHEITILESLALGEIVSCSQNYCLYVKDHRRKLIYRYDLSKNTTTEWSVSGNCSGLSVNIRHNLLVTSYYSHTIKEYRTDGSLVGESFSSPDISACSMHCVQMSTGKLVVSQDICIHRICLADCNSTRIIKYYGGSPGSGVGQLNNPCQLVVDTHDNVLVADYNNNKVKLFSSTLTYVGDVVIPGHELNHPYALHFDEGSNRLYIGEITGGRLFVLSVK